jgi:hypothetical protein
MDEIILGDDDWARSWDGWLSSGAQIFDDPSPLFAPVRPLPKSHRDSIARNATYLLRLTNVEQRPYVDSGGRGGVARKLQCATVTFTAAAWLLHLADAGQILNGQVERLASGLVTACVVLTVQRSPNRVERREVGNR